MTLNQTKFLSESELNSLKQTLNKFRSSDTRNVVLIDLALKTGARATELLNLTRLSLNHSDKTIQFKGIKGSRDREIPVSDDLFKALVDLSIQGDRIFPISYSRLVQVWHMYRPIKKKFHGLRHSFAIEVFKATKDLRLVQLALGHVSITNTMVYLDYMYSKQEMKRVMIF